MIEYKTKNENAKQVTIAEIPKYTTFLDQHLAMQNNLKPPLSKWQMVKEGNKG